MMDAEEGYVEVESPDTERWHIPTDEELDVMDLNDAKERIRGLGLYYAEISQLFIRHNATGNLDTIEDLKRFVYNMRNLPEIEKRYREYTRQKEERESRPEAVKREEMWLNLIMEIRSDKVFVRRQHFADLIIDTFHPVTSGGVVWIYQDGIYRRDNGEIRSFIGDWVRKFQPYEFNGTITNEHREIMYYVKGATNQPDYPFDSLKYHIPVDNGVIRINPGDGNIELLPHDPEYRFTRKLPVTYNPDAGIENILDAFRDWVGDDYEYLIQLPAIAFIQAWEGAQKIAYLFEGKKDGGKTTYCELLYHLFGRGAYAEVDLRRLTEDRFAFAGLEGRLINIVDDLDAFPARYLGIFKNLTGSIYHRIERKGEDGYESIVTAPHIFTCNKPPEIKDINDDAFWSRWNYIIFPNTFNRDESFKKGLFTDENLSAFLNLIIQEVIDIGRDSTLIKRMDAEEVRSLWVVAADEIAGFVRDSCRRDDPDQWIAKGELYDEYKRWCEKKGKVPESQKRVTTSLSRIGILGFYPSSGGGRKKQVHAYKGIRWNEEISQYRKPKTVDQGVLSV